MHIAVILSVQNGKTYRSKLLRRSFRDDQGRVQKQTLANLSHLPDAAIDLLRAHLAERPLSDPSDAFQIVRSRAHGSVLAVREAFRRLGLARLFASQPAPQRELVCAMIAARILRPQTKLATARWWHGTSLPDYFDLRQASAEDLYAAMDWLLQRQHRIQGKLAREGAPREPAAAACWQAGVREGCARTRNPAWKAPFDGKPGRIAPRNGARNQNSN